MKKWAVAVAVFIGLFASLSGNADAARREEPRREQAAVPARDLTGVYRCEGRNPDGERYAGTVIIRNAGSAYQLFWLIGSVNYSGVAVQQGDRLSSSWESGDAAGIVVYKAGRDGRQLEGEWAAYPGDGPLGAETLTFLRNLE